MSFLDRFRAFAQFLKTEFSLVAEERHSNRLATVPATGQQSGMSADSTPEHRTGNTPLTPARSQAFVSPDFLAELPRMSRSKIDALEFGCIKVSDTGAIEIYNKYQANFAGIDQKSAIGRNFFRELAPCTNNRLIFGRFKEGVAEEDLNSVLTYAFTYKMRPTLVKIHLYRDATTKTNWVLVQKHDAVAGK